LLAFSEPSNERPMRALLQAAAPQFPRELYAHLTPGLKDSLARQRRLGEVLPSLKMALADESKLARHRSDAELVPIEPSDLATVSALYDEAYPDHWFDARMLETGCYFGVRDRRGGWLAAAGVHVHSPAYRVAALGNIIVRPEARGRGLGAAVTHAVCRHLRDDVDVIGLNVSRDNAAAIACYRKLGFEVVAEYEELTIS
jgi:ribosomal protein S18 acetylase RimI-like enzyme